MAAKAPFDVGEEGVVYEPTEETLALANVTAFMEQHGIADLDELIKRSQDDVEWFWGAVETHLGLSWFEPYDEVLDDSDGIAWSKWYVGGKTNVALNCVDRHAMGPRRNKVAIIWEGEDGEVRKWTYRDLYAETSRIADLLKELGVGKGDAVGVYMPMVPETAAVLLAICKVGGIFIPLFSGYGAEAVETRLNDAEATVLFCADGFFRKGKQVLMKPVADEAVAACPTVEHVVVYNRLDAEVPWDDDRDRDYHEALKGRSRDVPSEPMDSEDPWMVIYTSGTTGRPKGAVHVHGGFTVKVAQEVAHQCDLHEDDILWWFTDMGWIMGPWEVVGVGALGGTMFFYEGAPDHPDPGRMWRMVERHGITGLGVSPTLVRSLMTHGEDWPNGSDLSSLRILGSTGEPWNPEPWMWLFDHVGGGRCPIINLSGGTEVGACFLSPLPITPLKPCSLGHPSLGMAVAVLDLDGNEVPTGTVGELACTEPWPGMTRGLYKDDERYLETYWSTWDGIWYHGDFASVDEEGYWYLHGRSDDTIKIAGKRVGPAEVESAVVDTGLVVEAAAVGLPHEVKGEQVWVFCIPSPDVEPDGDLEATLTDAVVESLGKPFKPGGIVFVDDLPRTRNGKILRRGVRARAMGEDPGDLSSLGNPEALEGIGKVL